ncbi:hypothetical protein Dsin_022926 [Dipteronia sinensis]|uniref:Reverse transcriptase domain-containing protein n=1 Tax=Dipteronia sinensis TaxID=43782 RepID=A0AAE0E0D8_9ROSI|nr:hypothetical protein Dsin_022926 [Dipteronia sinensis]
MGFGLRWRMWMKWCISTPSMSVLINGSPSGGFVIERGLLEGDPLSLFLFNLAVECLSRCFEKAVDLNMVRGIGFGNDEVHVSHLQYADDTILFLEPKMEYLVNSKRILRCFEMVSSLRINFHKPCMVKIGKKRIGEDDWAPVLKCKEAKLPIPYLGMPFGGRPRPKGFWNSVMERIQKRLAH